MSSVPLETLPLPLKILLIDDHPLFRCGLRMALANALESVEIFERNSLEELTHLSTPAPDIVLLDIQLQGLNGLDGIAVLKRRWPRVVIVVLSADDAPKTVQRALDFGAAGFVAKADNARSIVAMVQRIRAGVPVWDPPADAAAERHPRLTPRQCEVLDLLCHGLSNKLIGKRLNLSENTVRWHVQALLAALQVASRSEAVFAARRVGLIH